MNNENNKRERWAVSLPFSHTVVITLTGAFQFENSLRRHNHVGLAHALLAALAKTDLLENVQKGARKVMQERIEKRQGMDIDDD